MTYVLLARAAMPIMRMLEPERAHDAALLALRAGLAGGSRAPDDPRLEVHALGCRFGNPIGLAAGFDKNALATTPLARLGFGFLEVGTVTLNAQPGNPKPRLFRLERDDAVINRFGFNNRGVAALLAKLPDRAGRLVPLGINVGLNKTGSDPQRDYPDIVARVAPHADYVVINVSSPNTPGLRDLQAEDSLSRILAAVNAACPIRPKLLVKLSPDLSEDGLRGSVAAALGNAADGLIVSNTTLDRPAGLQSRYAAEQGGLSGPPLKARATEMLRQVRQLTNGQITLIGCGGISSGRDVLNRVRAGADLVQLYTAFAYSGPALLPRLCAELVQALRCDGFAKLADACGVDA